MKNLFVKNLQKHRFYLLFFLGLGVLILLRSLTDFNQKATATDSEPAQRVNPRSADTFIPSGMVLVPIELSNAPSLGGILSGVGGVVDLFYSPSDKSKPKRVAKRVKLLRAPLNPEQFAVLLPENAAAELLQYAGSFFAVIQNPTTSGSSLERPLNKKERVLVLYQQEDLEPEKARAEKEKAE